MTATPARNRPRIRKARPAEIAADFLLSTHPWVFASGPARFYFRDHPSAIRFVDGYRQRNGDTT